MLIKLENLINGTWQRRNLGMYASRMKIETDSQGVPLAVEVTWNFQRISDAMAFREHCDDMLCLHGPMDDRDVGELTVTLMHRTHRFKNQWNENGDFEVTVTACEV